MVGGNRSFLFYLSLGFSQNLTQHQICFVLYKTVLKTRLAGCWLCYVITLTNTMFWGDYSKLHGRFCSIIKNCILWISMASMKIHLKFDSFDRGFFELSGNFELIYEAQARKDWYEKSTYWTIDFPTNSVPVEQKKAYLAMIARFTSLSNNSQCLEPINNLFNNFPSPSGWNICGTSM